MAGGSPLTTRSVGKGAARVSAQAVLIEQLAGPSVDFSKSTHCHQAVGSQAAAGRST